MNDTACVTVTVDNIDALPRLAVAPQGAAVMDVVPEKLRYLLGGRAIRWAMTLEDGRRMRSQYFNDLIDWPKGGREATYFTERAMRAYGAGFDGEYTRCAGLIADSDFDVDSWRETRIVG